MYIHWMTLIGVPNIANDKLLRGFQGCRFLKLGDLQVTKGFHSQNGFMFDDLGSGKLT